MIGLSQQSIPGAFAGTGATYQMANNVWGFTGWLLAVRTSQLSAHSSLDTLLLTPIDAAEGWYKLGIPSEKTGARRAALFQPSASSPG